jgi:hypothetical protein
VDFLARISGSDGQHCLQTFDESAGKNRQLARTLHGSLAIHFAMLAALNARGAGVFATINKVRPGQPRTSENVEKVRSFFADCDNPLRRLQVEAEIARRRILPSFVVESSPGKRHYYWLTNDCPLGAFKPMQRAIAAALGTDPSVCDLSRVMRLPGFIHQKGEPFLVREVAL